jgi:hypothetical protein
MNKGGFSWKKATGISAQKAKISRSTGIPLTRSGRQRKVGRAVTQGRVVLPGLLLVSLILVALLWTFQAAAGSPSGRDQPHSRVGLRQPTVARSYWSNVIMVLSNNKVETRSRVFSLSSAQKRAVWHIYPKSKHWNCMMTLIPSNETPDYSPHTIVLHYDDSAGQTAKNTSGTRYFGARARRYYVWVSSGGCYWDLKIQQKQ